MDELLNNKIADCYDNNKTPFLCDRQLTRVGVRIHVFDILLEHEIYQTRLQL